MLRHGMSSPPDSDGPAGKSDLTSPDGSNGSGIPAYEAPELERPASSTPTEAQLEREMPGGHQALGRGHDPYAAFRYGNYQLYAAAFWMSVIGGQMQNAAVGWETYKRTGSALSLGWLGL